MSHQIFLRGLCASSDIFEGLIGCRDFLMTESVKCEHYSNITVK